MSENPPQPIEHIVSAARREFMRQFNRFGWYLLILVGGTEAFLLYRFSGTTVASEDLFTFLLLAPWFGFFIWYALVAAKMRGEFWKKFAASRGWTYEEDKDISAEKALLFTVGRARTAIHAVTGTLLGQPLSIFEYEYTLGGGKHKRTYHFTVFELLFSGSFPHLFLNNTENSDYLLLFNRLSLPALHLPAEFEKRFKLSAPKQYEIEAFQIFSPDTLAFLLSQEWPHDFELVDRELIITRPRQVQSLSELETELAQVEALALHLAPKLNRLAFTPIGDHPAEL